MDVLQFIYTTYLRVAGICLLAICATLGSVTAGYWVPGTPVPMASAWLLVSIFALGVLLMVRRLQPWGLRRPRRRTDAIWVLPHSAIAALIPFLAPPLAALAGHPEAAGLVHPLVAAVGPALLIAALLTPGLRRRRVNPDIPGFMDRRAASAAAPATTAKRIRTPEPGLPAIGVAMKVYAGADWLILRLMGLGLVAVAWMLHGLIDGDRLDRAAALTHGVEPQIAMWVLAALGAAMALPFVLPRAIVRPRHVAGGMIKAAIIVIAAMILLEPLRMAVGLWAPDIYQPTLLATLPTLFRSIAGIAVTSVLLVAFFRQLGTLPGMDPVSDRGPTLTSDELREMRTARMG